MGARGAATAAEARGKPPAPRDSPSFTLNLFRGRVEPAQVFPFPEPLSEEQRQTLRELVPPVEKFFQEVSAVRPTRRGTACCRHGYSTALLKTSRVRGVEKECLSTRG